MYTFFGGLKNGDSPKYLIICHLSISSTAKLLMSLAFHAGDAGSNPAGDSINQRLKGPEHGPLDFWVHPASIPSQTTHGLPSPDHGERYIRIPASSKIVFN